MTNLFAVNLNYKLTGPELAQWFEQAGEVHVLKVFLNSNGSFNGACRVTYNNSNSVNKAVAMFRGQFLCGRKVLIHLDEFRINPYSKRFYSLFSGFSLISYMCFRLAFELFLTFLNKTTKGKQQVFNNGQRNKVWKNIYSNVTETGQVIF